MQNKEYDQQRTHKSQYDPNPSGTFNDQVDDDTLAKHMFDDLSSAMRLQTQPHDNIIRR